MSGDDAIDLTGEVSECLPAGRYRVVLANGHRLVTRVPRRLTGTMGLIGTGDRLRIRVCPGDMSQGVVVSVLERITNHESSRISQETV